MKIIYIHFYISQIERILKRGSKTKKDLPIDFSFILFPDLLCE